MLLDGTGLHKIYRRSTSCGWLIVCWIYNPYSISLNPFCLRIIFCHIYCSRVKSSWQHKCLLTDFMTEVLDNTELWYKAKSRKIWDKTRINYWLIDDGAKRLAALLQIRQTKGISPGGSCMHAVNSVAKMSLSAGMPTLHQKQSSFKYDWPLLVWIPWIHLIYCPRSNALSKKMVYVSPAKTWNLRDHLPPFL